MRVHEPSVDQAELAMERVSRELHRALWREHPTIMRNLGATKLKYWRSGWND